MEILHCLLMVFCLEYAAGQMSIRSNVTTAGAFETYFVECISFYRTVAFYKNGANFTTARRDAVDKPCVATGQINCTIKKSENTYIHEIVIKVPEEEKGNVTWQCKHVQDQKTKSDLIYVNIKETMVAVENTEVDHTTPTSNNMVLLIGVSIGVFALLVMTIIAIVIIVRKRKQAVYHKEVENQKVETREVIIDENMIYCSGDDYTRPAPDPSTVPVYHKEVGNQKVETSEVIIDENMLYCSGDDYTRPAPDTSTGHHSLDDDMIVRNNDATVEDDDDIDNMYTEIHKETKPEKVERRDTSDTDGYLYAEVNKNKKH